MFLLFYHKFSLYSCEKKSKLFIAIIILMVCTYMQLEESNQASQQQVWDPNAHAVGYGRQAAQPQGDGFFQPIECEPTLQIG